MNLPHRPTPARATALALAVLLLSLLSATGAHAALQDIDINCAPAPGMHVINATVGTALNQDVGVLSAAGNVFWDFSVAPAGCGPGPTSFNCNGVTVALPPGSPGSAVASSAKVTVSGTPTAAGSFSFRLVVTSEDGLKTCSRDYQLVISAPFDVVFVLDRSGSMGGTGMISPPASDRWDALKIGVNNFTPMISSVAQAGSRFGLTLFASSVLANNSFPAGLTAVDGGLAAAVNAEMVSQTPSGATAMGLGLKNGMGKMTDAARPRVVVLFTDGEQNVAPTVNLDGCSFSDGTKTHPGCPAVAGPGTVKIVTVGIGGPGSDYLTTLQALAQKNRGTSIITANGSSFTGGCTGNPAAAFSCAIAPALVGNSPQMVTTDAGSLTGPVSLPFDLNEQVDQLLIQLSFSRKFEIPSLAQILAGVRVSREGNDVTKSFEPVIVGNFTNSVLLRGRFPLRFDDGTVLPPEGSYSLELVPVPNTPTGLEFQAVVFADDHRLDMDWRVSPALPRVRQPFRPTVSLAWLGRPVTDATVEALILKPGDDLGDLLARDPRKVDPSSAPDAGSPGLQKYLELLEDPDFLARLLPEEQRLTLRHQGDGVYSEDFDPGEISGVYQVFYRVRGDSGFGKVERQAFESVYVRFGTLDLAASEVSTTVAGNLTTIDFRPVTTVGRFLGPANASALSVTGSVEVESITDHQDGRYTLLLRGDPDTEISISLLDEEIYRGKPGGFGADTGLAPDKCAGWPRPLRWLCRLFQGKR